MDRGCSGRALRRDGPARRVEGRGRPVQVRRPPPVLCCVDGDEMTIPKLRVQNRLVNIAIPPPGAKYKISHMPFVRRENISNFLRAVQASPVGLPDHDVFLTVDLYDGKDPAQVLQCLGAFSRRANVLQPLRFHRTLGPRGRGGTLSPQSTGFSAAGASPDTGAGARDRKTSDVSQGNASTSTTAGPRSSVGPGSVRSPGKSGSSTGTSVRAPPKGSVSTWSRKSDESSTAPAWNIHQYGYMGGASQANQGISFGATRQITSSAPAVTTWADKERRRREAAEQERIRVDAEAAERRRRLDTDADDAQDRLAEETRARREKESLDVDAEKARWAEQERKWKVDEDRRLREEKAVEARLGIMSRYLSQRDTSYKDGLAKDEEIDLEREKVRRLERELELAKARERRYEAERQQLLGDGHGHQDQHERTAGVPAERPVSKPTSSVEATWQPDHHPIGVVDHHRSGRAERIYRQEEWNTHHIDRSDDGTTVVESVENKPRPLPEPDRVEATTETGPAAKSIRPLPDPYTYTASVSASDGSDGDGRIDRFRATNPASLAGTAQTNRHGGSKELGPFDSIAKHQGQDGRREQAQPKTKAGGGWTSKSLLEREMECERQRQQEWEEAQMANRELAAVVADRSQGEVVLLGLDLGQDGGRRRQIIGPRPPPP